MLGVTFTKISVLILTLPRRNTSACIHYNYFPVFCLQSRPENSRTRFLKLSEVDGEDSSSGTAEGGGAFFAYNILGLSPHTKYAIRVQTQNEAGWSPESKIFKFTTSQMGKI